MHLMRENLLLLKKLHDDNEWATVFDNIYGCNAGNILHAGLRMPFNDKATRKDNPLYKKFEQRKREGTAGDREYRPMDKLKIDDDRPVLPRGSICIRFTDGETKAWWEDSQGRKRTPQKPITRREVDDMEEEEIVDWIRKGSVRRPLDPDVSKMKEDYVYLTFLEFCKARKDDKKWQKTLRKNQQNPNQKTVQEKDMETLERVIQFEVKDTTGYTTEQKAEHEAQKQRANNAYMASSNAVGLERRDNDDPEDIRPDPPVVQAQNVWSWKEDIRTRAEFCDRLEMELERVADKIRDDYRPALGSQVHHEGWTSWTFQHYESKFGRQRPGHLYIFKKSRQVYIHEPPGITVLAEVLKKVALPP